MPPQLHHEIVVFNIKLIVRWSQIYFQRWYFVHDATILFLPGSGAFGRLGRRSLLLVLLVHYIREALRLRVVARLLLRAGRAEVHGR